MKASVINQFGPPSVFEYTEQYPIPEIEPHQVLIRVKASSVNPIDWKTRNGSLRFILGGRFPKVLGYDVAGVIDQVGDQVKGWQEGDRVSARLDQKHGGAYAEFAKCGAQVLARIPESMDFETAAAIPLAGLTAYQGLCDFRKVGPGDRILVIGATGGVGSFAVQIGVNLGAEVTAVASPRGLHVLKSYFKGTWLNYESPEFWNSLSKYDLIFDTVGGYSYPKMRRYLNPGGAWVTTLPRIPVLFYNLLAKFRGQKAVSFLMKSRAHELRHMHEWFTQSKLMVPIHRVFPLRDVKSAHEESETKRSHGKIIISMK